MSEAIEHADHVEELPHAQWICGEDAAEGHLCLCSGSRTECACVRHAYDSWKNSVTCGACGEAVIAIDFASGEPASPEQVRALTAELRPRNPLTELIRGRGARG